MFVVMFWNSGWINHSTPQVVWRAQTMKQGKRNTSGGARAFHSLPPWQSTRFQKWLILGLFKASTSYIGDDDFGFHISVNSRDRAPHSSQLASCQTVALWRITKVASDLIQVHFLFSAKMVADIVRIYMLQCSDHTSKYLEASQSYWTCTYSLVIIGIYSICYHKIKKNMLSLVFNVWSLVWARSISVSFLIRTSGKEYHNQAGSTIHSHAHV